MPNTPASDPHPQSNQLNPGPAPRRRRKFGCKAILCTVLVLVCLGACWLGYKFLRTFFNVMGNPHRMLHQNMEVPYRPQDVVRPLVDANQTFDIVATVWLHTETDSEAPALDGVASDERGLVLHENPIFAGTVFRGLTLKDKKKKTSVNLAIPTTIFKRRNLNNYDLRASFVLVPNSPSLLDNATEYSNWKPTSDVMYTPPVRSWPHSYKPSIGEDIVDSYGAFIPLIAFYNIQSKCPSLDISQNKILDEEDEYDDVDEENTGEPEISNVGVPHVISEQRKKWQSTNGKSVLAAHPYIITRSFLRVVDMTHVLNKKAYDESHGRIKSNSCGRYFTPQGRIKSPSWKDCIRNFGLTGSQEVRIKLSTKSKKSSKERTEWAYAPYLAPSINSWGPLDLVPVPVNREFCRHSDSLNTISEEQDQTSMNITWNIAFAGRTPPKLWTTMLDDKIPEYNMTSSEAKLAEAQAGSEVIQSFFGHHTRDNFHVRWQFFLTLVATILLPISTLFEVHYWYTRSSTVGISTSGMSFVAGATLASSLLKAAEEILKDQRTFKSRSLKFAYSFITDIGWCFSDLAMIKAITRAEIHWRKGRIPTIRFSPSTHAERAGGRIDGAISIRFKAITFILQAAILYFLYSQQYFLINRRGASEPFKSRSLQLVASAYIYTVYPAINLGWMLQIILNYRMKTFAGAYRVAVYIILVKKVIALMACSPWIVGESTFQRPVGYQELFEIAWCSFLALQAFIYPSVPWVDEEEENK